jgi:hypothetical protein
LMGTYANHFADGLPRFDRLPIIVRRAEAVFGRPPGVSPLRGLASPLAIDMAALWAFQRASLREGDGQSERDPPSPRLPPSLKLRWTSRRAAGPTDAFKKAFEAFRVTAGGSRVRGAEPGWVAMRTPLKQGVNENGLRLGASAVETAGGPSQVFDGNLCESFRGWASAFRPVAYYSQARGSGFWSVLRGYRRCADSTPGYCLASLQDVYRSELKGPIFRLSQVITLPYLGAPAARAVNCRPLHALESNPNQRRNTHPGQ